MELLVEQIRELIKNPKNKVALERAVAHQDRIAFHAQAVDALADANGYKERYFDWVKEGIRLSPEKLATFKAMMRFPLHTTSLISSIFDEFTTIFSAQDSYREVQFSSPDFRTDFDEYLKDIKLQDYVASSVFQAFKERHNSLLVIDLPAVQDTDRPRPYFYELPIQKVIDIDVEERAGKEQILYVIFKTDIKDQVACFDGTHFRLFLKQASGEYLMQAEVPHNLEYCPVTFVSAFPLNASDRITRKSPLTESVSDLDWLLFLVTAKRQYEVYGAFPFLWMYEQECDFTDGSGAQCNNGRLIGTDRDGNPFNRECPACSSKSITGPGTLLKVPMPRTKDEVDAREPMGIVPPDINSLKNLSEELERVEWDIFTNVVGGTDGVISKQAINEIQASAIVESKRKKYLYIASNFEHAEKFITDTFGRLMFPEYFEGSTINYGSQFDLYTADNVQKQLDALKKTGVPQYIIDQTLNLYVQSANRNNNAEQMRMEILKNLEPYPTMSVQECVNFGLKDADFQQFVLKSNFAKFVSDFETDNGSILEWGMALTPQEKIRRLRKIFSDYVKDIKQPEQPNGGQP